MPELTWQRMEVRGITRRLCSIDGPLDTPLTKAARIHSETGISISKKGWLSSTVEAVLEIGSLMKAMMGLGSNSSQVVALKTRS